MALVGDQRYRRVRVGSESIDIGAELRFDGIRCEAIKHLWRAGEPETLLCRRLAAAPGVEPPPREHGWWSTECH